MITSLNLGINGRLGNQLFQYAALKALALKNNYEVKIPAPESRAWHGQECLLDKFNIDCDYITDEEVSQLVYRYVEQDYMSYDPEFFNTPDESTLDGYFQSIKYFAGFEEQIKKELTPNKEDLDRGAALVDDLRKSKNAEVVSIHLRRGDNTDGSNPDKLLCNMYGSGPKLDPASTYGKYLEKAKEVFKGKKVVYLVFSGGARGEEGNHADLKWCLHNFHKKDFVIASPASPLQDFSRIMSCDHNILSHVSSFGWWAAYVNQNKNKIMVAPNNYHPDRPEYTHREGFFSKEFTLV